MAQNAMIEGGIRATQSVAASLSTATLRVDRQWSVTLESGTTDNKADLAWESERTLAASATEDLDLAGVLTAALGGGALTFARIKGLQIEADAANTNDVVIGAAGSNPWAALLNAAGTLTLKPGASVTFGTAKNPGWPVTAGTGDLLKVANSGGGTLVKYRITMVGCSA